ncbi:nucleotidyltransferase domain-containing protein [Candidatus Woesearchaeota archaeon]|nr:nucleotidyltransferase domain-containing protein [Candidatus Woesearchaeota archaeon]
MFIENLISSKAKVKILRVLSESRSAFSLKNIKNETELSLGIIHESVQDLVGEKILLKIRGTGKERLFKFNTENPFAHNIFELFRIEKTWQRKEIVFLHTWNVLENAVSKIKEKSNLILLFGSQSRGDSTLRSDIDLLVIPKNSHEEILNSLHKVKSKNKLNPTVVSLESFKSDIRNNTLFYKNIKSDSIILHIEPEIKKDVIRFLEDTQYEKKEAV